MGCLRCRRSKPSVYYIKTSEWAECKAGYEWTVRQNSGRCGKVAVSGGSTVVK